MDRQWRLIGPALVVAVGVARFASSVVRTWRWTPDDAFITYRYARNLIHGLGFTFNRGYPRAEGVTSIIWTVLLAPFSASRSPEAISKGIGLVGMVGAVAVAAAMTGRALRRTTPSLFPPALVIALLGCAAPTAIHATSGMETGLDCLAVTAFCAAISAIDENPVWAVGLGLLCGLMRPENNLLVAVALATVIIRSPRTRRRTLRAAGFGYVVPGAVYMGARAVYFGHTFPLPYYGKVAPYLGQASVPRLFPGTRDVLGYLVVVIAILAVPIGVAVVKNPRLAPAVVGAASVIGFFFVPRPVMGYDWRFLWPLTPALAAIAVVGAADMANSGRLVRRLVTVWALASLAVFARADGTGIDSVRENANGAMSVRRSFGEMLGGLGSRHTIALEDVGAVPYLSRWTAIDTASLTDVHIATTGDHSVSYIWSRDPDIVVVSLYGGQPTGYGRAYLSFAERLRWTRMRVTVSPGYEWVVLVDPASTVALPVVRWSSDLPPTER